MKILIIKVLFIFLLSYSLHAQHIDHTVSESFSINGLTELTGKPFNYYVASIRLDNDENFIVSDYSQGTVIIFDSNGNFRQEFGRTGRGPGEFQHIMYVTQLLNNNYLVSDIIGRLTLFDSSGDVVNTYNVPIMPLTRFVELNEQQVLIPGFDRNNPNSLLYILNIESGEIEKSFFEPPFQMSDYGGILYNLPYVVQAIANDNYIFAFITFSNDLYIFDFDGNLIKVIEGIELKYFSNLQKQKTPLSFENPDEIMTSFTLISDLFWYDDSTILLQSWQATKISLSTNTHEGYVNLAKIDLEGNVLFEEKNTTPVFDYNRRTDTYFLRDSLSLEQEAQIIIEAKKIKR